MELGACRAGMVVRIVRVDVDPAARLRFGELGLRAGALVQVTHDVGAQGRVVAVGADRFALDSATCARITVEPATAGAVAGAVAGAGYATSAAAR
ncbi:FeoA domain-containing protein [Cellulomonas sp. 73-145]|uniref:FeoA domain-containing protein n=1 Tax=Cellulomonas sp. 73-145 TaxID=1895739 RepID=UPI001AD30FDB|nr:FeoA domain-containing protein [Cellulomonas sp. 73-145]MBN9326012.1 FeoA domain-containing protein [Cellulomonas sp.]